MTSCSIKGFMKEQQKQNIIEINLEEETGLFDLKCFIFKWCEESGRQDTKFGYFCQCFSVSRNLIIVPILN